MRRHIYEGDGKCVFCRNPFPREKLEDEHIIPEAIQGSLVIRRGTCTTCARRSNKKYENSAINVDLQIPRLLLRLCGKGIGKLPQLRHLPPVYAGDLTTDELGERLLDFPVESYPRIFALLKFPSPGLLCSLDRGSTITEFQLMVFKIGNDSSSGMSLKQSLKVGALPMMLAKIAYCYAMAEKKNFDGSQIRDFLLGKREDVYNFVGSVENLERFSTRHLHRLCFRKRGDWLTVLVHLFASCSIEKNAYPYEVVVGKKNEPSRRGKR